MTAPDAADLVESYLPLAFSIANKYAIGRNWLRDEFRSAAAFALWRAAVAFSEDRPIEWFPVAARGRIRTACRHVLDREHRKHPEAFREQPDGDGLDPTAALEDPGAPNPEVAAELRDDVEELERAIGTLTDRQREAVRLSLAAWPAAAIAETMGISVSRVNQLLGKAVEGLRAGVGWGNS